MLWRWTVGKKGVNRVTVYERNDAPTIYIEWWDDEGRHREVLTTHLGHPVTDRKVAQEAARRMSVAQERKRNLQAAQALGMPVTYTVADLLNRRHADLQTEWTPKYRKSRERLRAFWLDQLGAVTQLTAVTAAAVERAAKRAQDGRSARWLQDTLRYIVDSYAYAERKLKWIESRHNLSAVDMPKGKGKSQAYTLDEARALLPALASVDPVANWIGVVAFQTGRRLTAIRTLKWKHVLQDGDFTVIQFPGETDKARNTGQAVVYGLPERTDWSVPSVETCIGWLHQAEEVAGVEHIKGRAWHGFKRLYATLTRDMVGADKQAGTLKSTLETHYAQDLLEPKRAVARTLGEMGTGPATGTALAQTSGRRVR